MASKDTSSGSAALGSLLAARCRAGLEQTAHGILKTAAAHKSSSELFFLSNLVLGFRVISKTTVRQNDKLTCDYHK